MRVFITGGSGFVGRTLIRTLRARGDDVKALARSDAAAAQVEAAGAKAVRGDLSDQDCLARGMTGCEQVFHAAAKVEVWGRRADFEQVTIEGTRRALAAARMASVARFVHVSTEAVLLGGRAMVNADETWPLPERPLGLYPWSKGKAEEEVRAAARAGLHAVIVRPRAIWGADDTVLLPRLAKMIDEGTFIWIGGGHSLTSTCHVDNVCAGLMAAAERGQAGEAYFVTDGPPLSFRQHVSDLLEAMGKSAENARSVPLPVARALAPLLEAWWRLWDKPGEPPVTRTAVELVGSEITVNDDKARRTLGYEPVTSREQGLARLRAAWQAASAA